MGRKSIKKDKNLFQLAREKCGLTREKASEKLEFISPEKIEKIENEKVNAHPEDVVAMAKVYGDPVLCNFYCTQRCTISKEMNYAQIESIEDLSKITIGILNALNTIEKKEKELISIAADDIIDKNELEKFSAIQKDLNEISAKLNALQMWIKQKEYLGEM